MAPEAGKLRGDLSGNGRATPSGSAGEPDSKSKRLRVALADDDGRMLDTIAGLLNDRYEIVARVGDGESLVREVVKLRPDVAIVDISMPGMNGIEATRKITASSGTVKVIVLTIHDEPVYVEAALEAGARGYVLKFDASSELIPAITAVTENRSYLSRHLADATS